DVRLHVAGETHVLVIEPRAESDDGDRTLAYGRGGGDGFAEESDDWRATGDLARSVHLDGRPAGADRQFAGLDVGAEAHAEVLENGVGGRFAVAGGVDEQHFPAAVDVMG